MIKREFKINFKSTLIWLIAIILLFGLIYIIYPSIMNEANGDMINQMLATMPSEILKTFNMDIVGIDKVSGWFKTEGFTMYVLLISIYSAILGSNILVKEENDKTIEMLNSVPVKRKDIVTSKLVVGFTNIISLTLMFTVFNVICMALSNDLHVKELLLLMLVPLMTYLSIFSVTLFISTFFRKSKNTIGIAMLVVLGSYFLQIIGALSDKFVVFKYLSLFTLSDSRYIINNLSVHPLAIVIGLIIILVSIFGTYYNYDRKEFL